MALNEYEKFTEKLLISNFSLEDVKKLIMHDLVSGVTQQEPDDKHPNCKKFLVKLKNEEIIHIYVKNE